MRPVILVGGGGHCRSVIDVIETEGRFEIAGIVDSDKGNVKDCMGFSCIGEDTDLPQLVSDYQSALVTVGQIKSAEIRMRLFSELRKLGANIPVIVSPKSHVSRRSNIDSGTVIMHGAVVCAAADIGANCIINNQALIEHDVVVESHCHISTGAKVNGGAIVETETFIGSGAVIREGVRIGKGSIVGAGAVVLRNLSEKTLFRG